MPTCGWKHASYRRRMCRSSGTTPRATSTPTGVSSSSCRICTGNTKSCSSILATPLCA
nr:MAG: hypothetical protein [Molluscum contagiosum virus]